MGEAIELEAGGGVPAPVNTSALPRSNSVKDSDESCLTQHDGDDTTSIHSKDSDDGTLPLAEDWQGTPAHSFDEENTQTQMDIETGDIDEDEKGAPQSIIRAAIDIIKKVYSMWLLIFSIVLVMAAICTEQTTGTDERGIHPALAFIIFWFLICWLAMMEGGQGALVGLQPIDKDIYADSHPRSLKCTKLAHKGNNMERFIVGRQFLVVLVVFVSNLMSSAVEDASVLGLPAAVTDFFLSSGLALIFITIMIGQLMAQVNSSTCMLDFINNYFMLFTTYVSLGIEFSGLLHSVYLIHMFSSLVTGRPVQSNEPPRNALQNMFFWARVLVSLTIFGFALAVTLSALFNGQTTMWNGIPAVVSVVIFFFLMCFVGIMEGMQIALFAVINMPEEDLADATIAKKNCKLTFSGHNLQAFLIGRQILVTVCTFVIARISTLEVDLDAGDEPIFGVSDGLQEFFNTGLLAAVITTIVASLAWRVIAAAFPLGFLSNHLVYIIIRLCLLLEATGICSAAWLLAIVQKRIFRYEPDEVHIGTTEERSAAEKEREENTESLTLEVSADSA